VSSELLRSVVFRSLGWEDPDVLLGPGIGEDAAIIRVGSRLIAFKSDPITGSVDEVGWLAVFVNANDIATRGAVPRWFIPSILLPYGSSESDLREICAQIGEAASEVGASVVGGHTEVTAGIPRPIVAGSMIGILEGDCYFTSGGSREGDLLYMTKSAGLEGTAILSSDSRITSKFGSAFRSRCKSLLKEISVVKECSILRRLRGVTSMHDVTEGGLLGGVWELAEAAGKGIEINLLSVPVLEETRKVCEVLGLDPFRLIGSGSLLFTAQPAAAPAIEAELSSSSVRFSKIGVISGDASRRLCKGLDGKTFEIGPPSSDELWKGLG